MKKLLVLLTVVVLSLAFSVAFGDDVATMSHKDIGTLMYEDSLVPAAVFTVSRPIAEGTGKDVGIALYEEFLAHEKELAELSSKGMAGGGIRYEEPTFVDENERIWDTLLVPEGSQ